MAVPAWGGQELGLQAGVLEQGLAILGGQAGQVRADRLHRVGDGPAEEVLEVPRSRSIGTSEK